jgi:predicted MFS family arabinose efflux permease
VSSPAAAADPPAGSGGIAGAVLRIYPALAQPRFRTFWLGMLPGVIAFQMHQVASGYAAFTISGSATALGFVSLALGAPMLLFTLVGGVLADRLPRGRVVIATVVLHATAAAGLAALSLSGLLQVWHLVAFAFVHGTAFAFAIPTRQAYLAELAGPPNLRSAMALNSAGYNFSRIAGPGIGGALVAAPFIGIAGAFVIMTALYTVVLATLLLIGAHRSTARGSDRASGWSQLVEGLRYVTTSRSVMLLLALGFFPILFGVPYATLMPLFAERVFGVGPAGLGLLVSAAGAGALVGSLAVAGLVHLGRASVVQVGLGTTFGVALIVFALAPSFAVAIAALFVAGAASAGYAALNTAMLLASAEPRLYGRVMSISFLAHAAAPVVALPSAALADRVGGQVTVALAGAGAVIFILGAAVLFPPQRRGHGHARAEAAPTP